MGWSVLIGAEGGVLADYQDYIDFEFYDALYEAGAAQILLSGIGSNPAPAQGNIVKLVWDRGLASEQVHWQGYIVAAPKKEQGDVYVLRAYTLDAKLKMSQTGTYRNYLGLTPHAIAQAAGTPNPLMINSQGTTVLTYGSAAIPNVVNGANPGVALTQFVADSTTLLDNIIRLGWQSRYDGSSYGLEWTTTLEGANGSSPRFYLVRRRESRTGYTPEVFNIPDDFVNCRRGGEQSPGIDAVKVIGAGDGSTRIESPVVFIGTRIREYLAEDKAIFNATNATNMANRFLDIYSNLIDLLVTTCYRHSSPTRSGDTITVTQPGVANVNLRVMQRYYQLSTKAWVLTVGRPTPSEREQLARLASIQKADLTTPQFTDVKPEVLEADTQFHITALTAPVAVGAGAGGVLINSAIHTVLAGSDLTNLGESEGLLVQVGIDVDAATVATGSSSASGNHTHQYDKTTSVSIGTTDAAGGGATPEPHGHAATPNHTSTASGNQSTQPAIATNVAMAGPFVVQVRLVFPGGNVVLMQRVFPHLVAGVQFLDLSTYLFAAQDPGAPGTFTPTRIELFFANFGAHAITLGGTGAKDTSCFMAVYRSELHRHNEL